MNIDFYVGEKGGVTPGRFGRREGRESRVGGSCNYSPPRYKKFGGKSLIVISYIFTDFCYGYVRIWFNHRVFYSLKELEGCGCKKQKKKTKGSQRGRKWNRKTGRLRTGFSKPSFKEFKEPNANEPPPKRSELWPSLSTSLPPLCVFLANVSNINSMKARNVQTAASIWSRISIFCGLLLGERENFFIPGDGNHEVIGGPWPQTRSWTRSRGTGYHHRTGTTGFEGYWC